MTSPRERAQLQAAVRQQQEALVRDLLPVLDALERAEAHWRQVLEGHVRVGAPPEQPPQRRWGRLRHWWGKLQGRRPEPAWTLASAEVASAALVHGAGEGVELIRAQLLEVLRLHGLEPFESLGQPFDPERMRALGQRPAAGCAPGQVVEEAVRGYGWHGTLLREAQVMVAGS
jgi:molecular chaperone GrpE